MLAKVKYWIDRQSLLRAGDRVVAACSGGPDSIALVNILYALRGEYDFTLVVAHVDHMLRGSESRADADFVEAMCRKLEIDCYRTAIDVPRFIATMGGGSTEAAARQLRYKYLQEVAAKLGGAKIATGHHRDDQAETVLLNLLRGAGSTGLRGMQAQNGNIIRPLLSVSREEIAAYCQQQQLSYRIDQTNYETDYLRNRLRWELIPLLERDYNPNIKQNLWRTAMLQADEHDFLRRQAASWCLGIITEVNNKLVLDSNKLKSLHIAGQREVLRLALEKKRGSLTGITFSHVERLIWLNLHGRVGSVIELPGGIRAEKGYKAIEIMADAGVQNEPPTIVPPGIKLMIPGITLVHQLAIQVSTTVVSPAEHTADHLSATFDWDALHPPLYVRTRLPGDWFIPCGMPGRKKLKEFMIDAKIPRRERDCIPIFADGQGIIWIGGYRYADRAPVTKNTRFVLKIVINKEDQQ